MLRKNLTLLTAASVFAAFIMVSTARAELVYENDAPATTQQVVDERTTLHDNLSASEKARVTQNAQTAQAAPVVAVPTAPISVPVAAPQVVAAPAVVNVTPSVLDSSATATTGAAPIADPTANLNRSELLRRERVREEVKNEDVLQERLEELRLQDEKRRADQIMANSNNGATPGAVALPQALYSSTQTQAAPQTTYVGAAAATAPQAGPAPVNPALNTNVVVTGEAGQSNTQVALPSESSERSRFAVSLGAGVASMSSQGDYQMNPKYALGLAITMAASDYLAFSVGYTYAVTGVAMTSSNPFVQQLQNQQGYYGQVNSNTLDLNNNIFNADLKLYLLGPDSMIRPFLGGGLAYSHGFINYDPNIVNAAQQFGASSQFLGGDYTLNEYMASLSAGLDVRVTRSISVGVTGKYYDVLSSSENGQLNNYGFYNQSYLTAASNFDKQIVGGSLAGASFFTVLAGVNFSF